MIVLIVCATENEVKPFIKELSHLKSKSKYLMNGFYNGIEVDILITGIGMINTTYQLTKLLTVKSEYTCLLNIGICGSFNQEDNLGSVYEIIEETYAELGAENDQTFMDLKALEFEHFQVKDQVYYNTIRNPNESRFPYPKTTAITVNKVHGNETSINHTYKIWDKHLESMEGAAFFQVSLLENIPFYALRSISNYIEVRNKDRWEITQAINSLNKAIVNIFSCI